MLRWKGEGGAWRLCQLSEIQTYLSVRKPYYLLEKEVPLGEAEIGWSWLYLAFMDFIYFKVKVASASYPAQSLALFNKRFWLVELCSGHCAKCVKFNSSSILHLNRMLVVVIVKL